MGETIGPSGGKRSLELDSTMVAPSKRVHQRLDTGIAAGATSAINDTDGSKGTLRFDTTRKQTGSWHVPNTSSCNRLIPR